jgi:thiamine biosynthesis lipoprotein
MLKGLQSLIKWPVALLLAVFVLAGCQLFERDKVVGFDGQTMGTTFSVRWVDTNEDRIQMLRNQAGKVLATVNQQMSTYIPDSELSRFNKLPAGAEMEVSAALAQVVSEALSISDRSGGAFDVTGGPRVNLWGFGPNGRIEKAPTEQEIADLQERIGYQKVEVLNNPIRLRKLGQQYVDLSAIAKGYGVDQLAAVMEQNGINNYLVEIGGELRAKGVKPDQSHWRIAIESPATIERSVGKIINVKDTGIATSGDYRNYFEQDGIRFSHTIDPSTGKPITHKLASVTVLRPTCAEADALATTLMVLGEDKGYQFAKEQGIAAYFLVKADGKDNFIEKATTEFEQFVQTEE